MMSLSATQSHRYSNFLTFGRSKARILGIVAGETIFLGATFFAAEPPFLPLPFEPGIALLISGILTLVLGIALYGLLSSLGYRTYSVRFHSPTHVLKCWIVYLAFSAIVVYLGYLLLVYPYSNTPIPKAVDIGIGAVATTLYAISITSIIYAEDIFSENSGSKSEDITKFLSAADGLREKSESEIVDQPNKLLQAGESLLTGLQTSELEGTEQSAENLRDWLQTFKHRELQGQKKMVGDLPDSSTRFDVWEERYESFQYIRDELEKMDNSAIDRILLSIRGK